MTFTWTLRRILHVPILSKCLEVAACFVGRHFASMWGVNALVFHVREELAKVGDSKVRFAPVPGGGRVALTLDESWWRCLYFNGCHEEASTRFTMRHLRPGDTFVDVGANVGYYTMVAASVVGPTGRVYAFEPHPRVAALLALSIKSARLDDRITLSRVALSSSRGDATLYLPSDESNTLEASLVPSEIGQGQAIRVPTLPLDDYAAEHSIKHIRLIKIDVEGAELEVLMGATSVLSQLRADAILCEFVPSRRRQAQEEVLSLLTAHGYRSFFPQTDGSLVAHDGSIPSWEWGNLCFLSSRVIGEDPTRR
jgi:FkbM family methyltransferase